MRSRTYPVSYTHLMTKLTVNTKYYGGSLNINEIRLINAPDSESVSHYVEVGAADMYYSDISDGNIVRMSGKKVSINLNRDVYKRQVS